MITFIIFLKNSYKHIKDIANDLRNSIKNFFFILLIFFIEKLSLLTSSLIYFLQTYYSLKN